MCLALGKPGRPMIVTEQEADAVELLYHAFRRLDVDGVTSPGAGHSFPCGFLPSTTWNFIRANSRPWN
jgi:hypothetical protein